MHWLDSRTILFSCAAALLVANASAGEAGTESARALLAAEIEQVSRTTYILEAASDDRPEIAFRRFMTVDGCEIAAETVETGPCGERAYGLVFDLHRTRLPNPAIRGGPDLMMAAIEGHGWIGMLRVSFPPPYWPLPHGNTPENWPLDGWESFTFDMEKLAEGQTPRRLLHLLHQYRSEYCALRG